MGGDQDIEGISVRELGFVLGELELYVGEEDFAVVYDTTESRREISRAKYIPRGFRYIPQRVYFL